MVRKPKRMASNISGSEEHEDEDEEVEVERERSERSRDQNSDVRRGRDKVEGPAA